jgi:hypothetical protein
MGFDRRTLLKSMVSLAATLGFGGVSQAAVVSWSQSAQQAVKHKDSEDIMKTNTQQPIAAPWLALHSGQPDQQKVIAFYGTEVLPRLRDRSSRKAA